MSNPAGSVLVIGGHDSSGQAGVDVDRAALDHLGLEARIVVTAWTRQGASGVSALGPVSVEEWGADARGLMDSTVGAIKFGLLPGAEHIRAAGEFLGTIDTALPVVIDPVLAASSGDRFVPESEVPEYVRALGSACSIWTPNLPELAELTGGAVHELDSSTGARVDAAQHLLEAGARAVLVKGGHTSGPLEDLLLEADGEPHRIGRERWEGPGLRGTGCRLASALAGRLCRGEPLLGAARAAGDWVAECIRGGS